MHHPATQTLVFLYGPVPFAVAVQSLSCVQLFAPQGLQHTRLLCPPLSPGVEFEFAQIQVCCVGDAI